MKEYKLFINGDWKESASAEVVEDINPASGEAFAKVHQPSDEDIDAAVAAAVAAGKEWRKTGPTVRERVLIKAAEILDRRRDEIIPLLIEETGCVFGTAWYQVEYSIDSIRSAAGECRRLAGETIPSDIPGLLSMTKRYR